MIIAQRLRDRKVLDVDFIEDRWDEELGDYARTGISWTLSDDVEDDEGIPIRNGEVTDLPNPAAAMSELLFQFANGRWS